MTIAQPLRKVNMAPHRNHQSALGTSPRVTALLAWPPSSVPKKGVWMKLKYQSTPIQQTPARKCMYRRRNSHPAAELMISIPSPPNSAQLADSDRRSQPPFKL